MCVELLVFGVWPTRLLLLFQIQKQQNALIIVERFAMVSSVDPFAPEVDTYLIFARRMGSSVVDASRRSLAWSYSKRELCEPLVVAMGPRPKQ